MDLSTLSLADLKALADSFEGFEYDKRLGEEKLRSSLEAWIVEHPEVLNGEAEDSTTDTESESISVETTVEDQKSSKNKVKIKSIHRGEISTSAGVVVFDENGKAEVTAEQAAILLTINGYDKC